MRIKITEKQLNEVLGLNLSDFDNDNGIPKHNADTDIIVNDKIDGDAEQPTTDDINRKRSRRSYFGARTGRYTLNCSTDIKKKVITESNQELVDKRYTIPSHLYKVLNNNLQIYGNKENVNGVKRLKNLVNMKGVSYSEMYRLKNHFENMDKKSEEYKLLGGSEMERWVNQQIKTSTNISNNSKEIKKNLGIENAFIKKHQKTGTGTAHSQKNNKVTFNYE